MAKAPDKTPAKPQAKAGTKVVAKPKTMPKSKAVAKPVLNGYGYRCEAQGR